MITGILEGDSRVGRVLCAVYNIVTTWNLMAPAARWLREDSSTLTKFLRRDSR